MEHIVMKLFCFCGVILLGGCQTLRLVGGPTNMPNAGRIETKIQEVWHEVCYSTTEWTWSISNAIWACRELGYLGVWQSGRGRFGNGTLGHSVESFDCSIADSGDLLRCQHGQSNNVSCEQGNWAYVICAEPNYVGCYKDQLPRAMPYGALEDSEDMSVTKCIEHCRQLDSNPYFSTIPRYAGVEDGRQCFCGMDNTQYTIHGKAPEEDCSKVVCPGDPNQACGFIWKMAVYDVTKGYCEELQDPGNGTIFQGADNPRFGSSALFRCDPGYVLRGSNVTQCIVGNTPQECAWSSEVPFCEDEMELTTTMDLTTGNPTTKNPTTSITLTASGNGVKIDLTPTANVAETKDTQKDNSLLFAVLIGLVAFVLLILIVAGIIMCVFFGVVRGRKKTRQKAENNASANIEARDNEGYSHDDSNHNPVTVAVISNGNISSQKRNISGNRTRVQTENTRDNRSRPNGVVVDKNTRVNKETDRSIENNHKSSPANEPQIKSNDKFKFHKVEREISALSDVSEDESEGSLSLNLHESLTPKSEDIKHDTESNKEVEADIAESGYTSDYMGLNGAIEAKDSDRVVRTGSNLSALSDHFFR